MGIEPAGVPTGFTELPKGILPIGVPSGVPVGGDPLPVALVGDVTDETGVGEAWGIASGVGRSLPRDDIDTLPALARAWSPESAQGSVVRDVQKRGWRSTRTKVLAFL